MYRYPRFASFIPTHLANKMIPYFFSSSRLPPNFFAAIMLSRRQSAASYDRFSLALQQPKEKKGIFLYFLSLTLSLLASLLGESKKGSSQLKCSEGLRGKGSEKGLLECVQYYCFKTYIEIFFGWFLLRLRFLDEKNAINMQCLQVMNDP